MNDTDRLDAARQFLAGVWPVLNVIEQDGPLPGQSAEEFHNLQAQAIREVKKELAPLYEKAMGLADQ